MLRHEFQPGKLIAGLFLTVAGVAFAGDAGGSWETPWFAIIPMVTGGLCLAGAAAFLTHAIRQRRAGHDHASPEPEGAWPSDRPSGG
ncbi:hypothetical protein AQJ43_03385 [Streptomyces avermitilis]|uniref:Secreted protein n=3 Tax=Streptomyces avermitilis TaxID=33903 RepID=Q82HN5_STRAW|nr:hypothetical protein [Streptomyces avermitilis]MYS99065.1 hypothetical protein [Streptomyces sp. SID5469]KUN56644.1 hypothetical protein AQJ43_03385 [Streptomyces avermitilis]OOV32632.1 hypothetical protein SM007_07390 [Streptomyces avermitilis]BAC71185.1 putative secreted protein [Streptomyces avermitilis MA-4680 = NBRC 14893]BBJ51362.1 hypothetical protein SAVMC3_39910 [Streptomyces avermitilis]